MSRIGAVGRVLGRHAYEAALAAAFLSSAAGVYGAPRSGAAARALPPWAVHPAAALITVAGLLTLGGLTASGAVRGGVRRVVARRVEQAGQILASGVLFAIAAGAYASGPSGTVGGSIYGALCAAAVTRAVQIGRVLTDPTRSESELE